MTDELLKKLALDLLMAERAVMILEKSQVKAQALLEISKTQALTDDQRETLESLTTRFARALDFLMQKLLRTIDKIELTDEGSILDRVNRFKKRDVLRDDVNYGILKDLRNQIVHEYIIEETDTVVVDAIKYTPLVKEILIKAKIYCLQKGFIQ